MMEKERNISRNDNIFYSIILAAVILLVSCSENVDESNRYVFTNDTAISFLQKHSDKFSSYLDLLYRIPISDLTETTVGQLLSARGHYTVFAPTNDAIQAYLDTLAASEEDYYVTAPSWDAFTDSTKIDSIRKVIVYKSIIDSGDDEEALMTSSFPITQGAEIMLPTLDDHKVSVYYDANDPDAIRLFGEVEIDPVYRDMMVTNGVVHQVNQVIAHHDLTAATYIGRLLEENKEGFLVMARVVDACGLMDTLSVIRDETYEKLFQMGIIPESLDDLNGRGFADSGSAWTPQHRKYGFTIFAEPDDFWRTQGIDPFDPDLLPTLIQWILDNHQYSDDDKFVTDEHYSKPENLLYQWITYHILPMRIAADRLVLHHTEYGYNFNTGELGIPYSEYYTTMGKRRLIKIYESKEAGGVYLNRFPILDNGRRGTGAEIGCKPGKEGSFVMRSDPRAVLSEMINCIIYPIDAPLSYNDNTRDNLFRERFRIDGMGMLPEVMNNDIRRQPFTDEKHNQRYFPPTSVYKYFDDLDMNDDSHLVYFNVYKSGWPGKQADEIKGVGRYDVTFRLPPVPRRGTYELRYAIIPNNRRGIAQVYFGDNLANLPVTDIPFDWTIARADSRTGWEPDTEDDDYNAEIDKRMHNHGYMNGPLSEAQEGNKAVTLRNYTGNLGSYRYIVAKQTMDPEKVYYLRVKNVLDSDSREYYMDFVEWASKEIYDNPEVPEDIW